MRVAAFTKYGRQAASTRQRLLQYLPSLARAGIEVNYYPLLDHKFVGGLGRGSQPSIAHIGWSYVKRLRQLLFAQDADVIWIYAELFPYLPAGFERLAFVSGKPVIYDFDDAFFVQYDQNPRHWARRLLSGKLEPLMRGATACTCGNPYLQDYALRFCQGSIVVPTVVDTSIYVPRRAALPGSETVIGWIGSPSTWVNMRPLLPLLADLCRDYPVRVNAVGAGRGAEADRFDGLHLLDWEEATEVAQVQAMDIGIMPLLDLPFQRGKSGYKLIQYMACALPSVASPVGVNSQILNEGESGLLASTEEQWREALVQLIGDARLRRRLGESARARAEVCYSLVSQVPRLIDVFRSAAGKKAG